MAAAFATIDATLTNPGATSTTWTLPVDLPAQGSYSVTAYGYDAFDQQDPSQTGATATYPVFPGDLPPTVTEALLAPTNGTVYLDGKIFVSGRVEDDQQIARVQVAVINSLNQYMSAAGTFTSTTPTFQNAFVNSPGSPGSNFSYTTPAIPTGNYRVQVRGVDQHNLTTPVPSERTATVTIPANNLPPVPAFTYTCAANVCSFDARSSGDENAATLTYSWAFGLNQGTATGPVPIRTYTAAGSFVVTLTAKDEFGVIATTTQTIVMTEPVVNVPPTPVLNPPSCAGLLCNFSAVGTLDANVGDTITYIWNWGDGTPNTTTQAAAHTFPADGTYTVTLTATDGWLKAATTTLAVTVTSIPVTNLPPTSVISVPTCTLLSCTFNGSTSTDTDGTILSYAWNFGDGQTGTGPTPAHVYATPGTYAITLTVTDDDGATGFASRSLVVTNGANPLPVPSFTSLCTGLTCTFDGSTSTDDGSIASYTWNFGNLQAGSGATPSVTYATGGTYLVRLTVVDNLGALAAC